MDVCYTETKEVRVVYQLLMSDSMVSLFLQVIPVTLLVGAAYGIFRYRYLVKRGDAIQWGREVVKGLFVCYLTGLTNLILVPNNFWGCIWYFLFNGRPSGSMGEMFVWSCNLIPSIIPVLRGELILGGWVKRMLIGNAAMFVPMGVLLPFVSEKARNRKLLLAAAIPLMVELLQPIVGRSFDVDDLICNFLGIVSGYLIAAVIGFAAKK